MFLIYESKRVFSWQEAHAAEVKSIFIMVARKNVTTIINLNVQERYLLCKCLLNQDGNKPQKVGDSPVKADVFYKSFLVITVSISYPGFLW